MDFGGAAAPTFSFGTTAQGSTRATQNSRSRAGGGSGVSASPDIFSSGSGSGGGDSNCSNPSRSHRKPVRRFKRTGTVVNPCRSATPMKHSMSVDTQPPELASQGGGCVWVCVGGTLCCSLCRAALAVRCYVGRQCSQQKRLNAFCLVVRSTGRHHRPPHLPTRQMGQQTPWSISRAFHGRPTLPARPRQRQRPRSSLRRRRKLRRRKRRRRERR